MTQTNMVGVKTMKQRFHEVVDVEMLPSKLTFFFTDGYFGSTMPFMNVFYTSIGLSATYAGLISGISLAVSSIFNPLWSTLADMTGRRKLIFIILCIGTGSTVFSMPWVEQLIAKTNTTCIPQNETKMYKVNDVLSVHKVYDAYSVRDGPSKSDCKITYSLLNVKTLFYCMLALNVVAWIFYTSLRCFIDGTVTNVANTRSTKKTYGAQRAISCIGYAAFNFVTGVIADHYHPETMSPYTAIFYVFLPCVICVVPFGCILLDQAKWDQKEENGSKDGNQVFKELASLFKRLDFIVFLMSVIVEGLVLNVFNCFFFMLMEHEMKSSKTLMAFALVLGVFFEIIMFCFASKVIKLFRGTIVSLIIGILSYLPRFLLMSYIQNPWYVLATQPLHSLGMGLAWTSIVEHTYKIVPENIKVTAISLMSSIVFIASSAIVNMGGGVMFDKYGGRAFFRVTGFVAGGWALFMILFYGGRYLLIDSKSSSVATYPDGISKEIDLEDPVKT